MISKFCIVVFTLQSFISAQSPVSINPEQLYVAMRVLNQLCPQNNQSFRGNTCEVFLRPTTIYGCNQQGNITYLSLYKHNCTGGSISAELGDMKSLTSIDIRDAGISGTLPNEITQMTALSILLIAGNQLRGTVPQRIQNMSALIGCTMMRMANETNCFDCPVPDLKCTNTLVCSNNCTQLVAPTFTSTTTITTTPPQTLEITTQTIPSTSEKYFLQKSTQLTTPTETTINTSSESSFVALTMATTETTLKKTLSTISYQMRTFTYTFWTKETTTSDHESDSSTSSSTEVSLRMDDKNVSIMIVLACSLVVAIPVIVVLFVMYESARAKSGAPKRRLFGCFRRGGNDSNSKERVPDIPIPNVASGGSLQDVSQPQTESEGMDIVEDSDEFKDEQRLEAGNPQLPRNQYDVVPKESNYQIIAKRSVGYQNVKVAGSQSDYISPFAPFTESIKKSK